MGIRREIPGMGNAGAGVLARAGAPSPPCHLERSQGIRSRIPSRSRKIPSRIKGRRASPPPWECVGAGVPARAGVIVAAVIHGKRDVGRESPACSHPSKIAKGAAEVCLLPRERVGQPPGTPSRSFRLTCYLKRYTLQGWTGRLTFIRSLTELLRSKPFWRLCQLNAEPKLWP